jgi:hypothetical protein
MTGDLLILGVLACLAILLAFATYLSAREWSILSTLRQYGIDATAQIEDLIKDTQGKGSKHYVLYCFFVGELFYQNKQQISQRHYKQYAESKTLNVKYLSSDPSISRLAGKDFDNTYRNLVSYVAFAAVIVFPPLIALWIITFIVSSLMLQIPYLAEKKKKRG